MAGKMVSVELDEDLALEIRNRAESVGYASDTAMIRDALRALDEMYEEPDDPEIEQWLQTEGRKRIAEYEAGHSTPISAEEMRQRMERYMKDRGAKRE